MGGASVSLIRSGAVTAAVGSPVAVGVPVLRGAVHPRARLTAVRVPCSVPMVEFARRLCGDGRARPGVMALVRHPRTHVAEATRVDEPREDEDLQEQDHPQGGGTSEGLSHGRSYHGAGILFNAPPGCDPGCSLRRDLLENALCPEYRPVRSWR
jgi:hypothetical protein